MRKRLVIALSIACVIAAAGIVLMCLNNNTEVRTADNKAAESFDALTTDNEPAFKEYSDIADPYERAEKIKEDNSGVNSDGYVISLKDDAGDDVIAAIDKAIADGAQIKALEYTDRTYTCSSLEEFSSIVDGSYVEIAEPDFEVKMLDYDGWLPDPNDTYYRNYQYNIRKLNVPFTWEYGFEGQDTDFIVDADGNKDTDDDIIIAVIDSGLNAGHEDIDESRIEAGATFAEGTLDTRDSNGHGTAVTGIIAATKNNNKGMAGLLQDVKIMPLRVFDGTGRGTMSAVTGAVNYAVAQKDAGKNIAVINMSLGGSGGSTLLKQACNAAMSKGIIVVCASGNDYDDDGHMPCFPAQYTMGVGSLDKNLNVSNFSQRWDATIDGEGAERKVWVTAPGESIVIPLYSSQNEYRLGGGTSFACPEVAALAAICKSIDNDMDQTEFMQLLKDTVDPSMDGETQVQDSAYGWGKVDFKRTIDKMIDDDTNPHSTVTVSASNVLGSEIRNASITVKKSDGSVVQATDGSWTLDKKNRYTITASATGYKTQTNKITPALDVIESAVTLEGTAKYPVSLSVKDDGGNAVPENMFTISVRKLSDSSDIRAGSDGKYQLNVGKYQVIVQSDQYYIYGDPEFIIDDMTENLSSGKTVNVVLRRDAVNLSWKDHKGTSNEKAEALVEIINSGNCDNYEVNGDDTDTYEMYGISINDLFGTAMAVDEEIVSAKIDGKRVKSAIIYDKEDPPDTSDQDNLPETSAEDSIADTLTEEEQTGETTDAPEYELEDASVEIDADNINNVYIALVHDPSGLDDIMSEYNSMRLVIDGGDTEDWLYAPSLITIETKASIEDCEVSGISDQMYTGKSITQDLAVKYKGETLTEDEDYSVEYKNNVKPGKASVVITGKGSFTGGKTVHFTIKEPPHEHSYKSFVAKEPTEDAEGSMGHRCTGCGDTYYTSIARIVYPTDLPSVKISKPAAAKKKMTVKWKKVSKKNKKKIGGIEIQVSGPGYYQTFTAGKGKASKKIGGLVSKQKYSVRIRAYNYIDGVKHVSPWSNWKTAKIK